MRSIRVGSLMLVIAVVAASCSSTSDDAEISDAPATTEAVPVTEPVAEVAPETTAAPEPEPEPEPEAVATTEPPPASTVAETTQPEPEPESPELPADYVDYASEIYADEANWVCLPGKPDDVCARDLDTTIVYADGTTEVEPFEPAADPAVDCFYVYPTTSNDPEANSDLIPAESEEIYTTLAQAARLGEACRVFAPIYRQFTLTALLGQVETDDTTGPTAYGDVVDSFKHFIANRSDGRPFVLIGHSQGAGMLRNLIAEEIDNEPLLTDRLVSAMLLGTSVGPDAFANVPPCASATDTGCLVTYSSYRDTVPPPDDGKFGRTQSGPAICVNPIDPAGGAAASAPYFSVAGSGGLLGQPAQAFDDVALMADITTPWVMYPDMVTIECVDDGKFGYLQLSITGEDGPRIDNIGGDLTPDWGMHLVDVSVAMGDLVDLVASQATAMS